MINEQEMSTQKSQGAGLQRSNVQADCYSAADRKFMIASQRLRATVLSPVLSYLSNHNITADHLTLWSLVFGLAFCSLFMVSKAAALICLFLHLLIDGLDGPLARHRGTASARGSLTDTACDQTVIAASTATLIAAGVVSGAVGAIYIFAYTLVVVFSMVRNALTVPYPIVLRPRILVYLWLVVECYWWPGTLNNLLGLVVIPLTWYAYKGFREIRRRLGPGMAG